MAAQEPASEPTCDPWVEVCEVSLRPNWDARSVLDLEVAKVTVEPTDEPPEALADGEVRASIGRYLVLQSEVDEPLVCLLPDAFAQLDDVPTDASICDCQGLVGCWDSTALFGLVGTGVPAFEGAGLLLKTRGGDLYRGRVLVADPRSDSSTLRIEYEGVM